MSLIHRVYAALLHLYPREFRDEFGGEMEAVFAEGLADAAIGGPPAIAHMLVREMADWPGAILREHWQARRAMETGTDCTSEFERTTWSGKLGAVVPLMLVPIVSFLGTTVPDWLGYCLLTFLTLPFIIGLLKGIPRWSLPYLGVFASLASFLLAPNFPFVLKRITTVTEPWVFRLVIQQGFPWVVLLLLTIFFVLTTIVLPPLRPVHVRIRHDWTLLSFGLYGAMVLGQVLTFEDYPHVGRGFYEILCSLILAVGAWTYLRSDRGLQRALVLFASITLAMTVATIGKALLITGPEWFFPRAENDWHGEAISTVIDGVWMVIVILIVPALVNLLPRTSHARQPV